MPERKSFDEVVFSWRGSRPGWLAAVGLLLPLLVLGAAGCSDPAPDGSAASPEPSAAASSESGIELPGVVVSTSWLAEHRGRDGLVILDARTAEEYAKGHIDGAINLPRRTTYDPAPT